MKRFLVRPGYVISASDDELHWVSARQIMDLNHVRPEECVVVDDRRPERTLGLTDEYLSMLLELTPMTYWYSPVGLAERRAYPIEAGLRAYDQVSRRRKWPHGYGHERPDDPVCEWDRRRLEAAFDDALKAQPVVAHPPCPTCKGEKIERRPIAAAEPGWTMLTGNPCPSCKGSGVDRLIPESEIREWIAARSRLLLPLSDRTEFAHGEAGALDRLRTWLDEREARQ